MEGYSETNLCTRKLKSFTKSQDLSTKLFQRSSGTHTSATLHCKNNQQLWFKALGILFLNGNGQKLSKSIPRHISSFSFEKILNQHYRMNGYFIIFVPLFQRNTYEIYLIIETIDISINRETLKHNFFYFGTLQKRTIFMRDMSRLLNWCGYFCLSVS